MDLAAGKVGAEEEDEERDAAVLPAKTADSDGLPVFSDLTGFVVGVVKNAGRRLLAKLEVPWPDDE